MKDERYNYLEDDFEDEEVRARFEIKDDGMADWALRTIRADEAEANRIKKIALDQIELLNNQIDEIDEKLEKKTSFLKGALRLYFQSVPHKETKTQETYKLLNGSLVMKKATQKMVKDDETLLKYFHEHNLEDFIKVKESPDWSRYKAECEILDGKCVNVQTGEVVECVTIEDVPETFSIK